MSRDRRKLFEKLANARVNKAIKYIELIGNLSVKSNYQYSADQVLKITNALSGALEGMKQRFENNGEPDYWFSLEKEE